MKYNTDSMSHKTEGYWKSRKSQLKIAFVTLDLRKFSGFLKDYWIVNYFRFSWKLFEDLWIKPGFEIVSRFDKLFKSDLSKKDIDSKHFLGFAKYIFWLSLFGFRGLIYFSKICPFCGQKIENDSSASETDKCAKKCLSFKNYAAKKSEERSTHFRSSGSKWRGQKKKEEDPFVLISIDLMRFIGPRCDNSDPWQDIAHESKKGFWICRSLYRGLGETPSSWPGIWLEDKAETGLPK